MSIDFYENEDLVKELKSFIFYGDYASIENWLVKYNIKNDQASADSLVTYITNKHTYNFFAFVPPMNNTKVIDNNHIKRTREAFEKRVISILNHLSLNEQLKLLNYQVEDDFSINHLKALDFKLENIEPLIRSVEFTGFIVSLFNKEKFSELDKINEYLKINTLEIVSNHAVIVSKEKNATSIVTLKDISDLQYQPVYDLLFNYTDKKFNYAVSLGSDLPYKEQAINIRNNVINIIKQEDDKSAYNSTRSIDVQRRSEESIEKYKDKCFYFELQNKIPNKKKLKNRMKI